MTDTLSDTLDKILRSGTTSNPALNKLLEDYANFHFVFLVVAGFFLVGSISFSKVSWTRFKTAPKRGRKWTFEKRTYFSFTGLGAVVGALLVILMVANAGNALHPRTGFAGTLDMISTAPPGTQTERVHAASVTWLQSNSADTPTIVQNAVHDRLAWQQPKAIICSALLVMFTWLSVRIWRLLIARSEVPAPLRTKRSIGLLLAGGLSVAACLLLTVMVIANTQASLAPLSLTVVNG